MRIISNKYAQVFEPNRLEFTEIDLESLPLKAEYVRLKIAYCGICGSDIEIFRGRPGAVYPVTLGHEYYGQAVTVGEKAGKIAEGALYASDPNFRCGTCQSCKAGYSNHCVNSSANLFFPRGFAEYIDIHHSYLVPIPSTDIPYLPALLEPLSVILHAMDIAENCYNEKVLVVGCGGMGTMLALTLYAKCPDVEVDLYDIIPAKSKRLAETMGLGIKALDTAPKENKYSLVFEVSGRAEGMTIANNAMAKKGTIVAVSRYTNQKVMLQDRFSYKEGSIRFVHLDGNGEPFLEAIDLLYSYWNREFDGLIDIQPLSKLPEILAGWEKVTANKTVIKIGE